MRSLPVRLRPGADLRLALEELGRLHCPDGGFVLCGIGSLSDPCLRLAGETAARRFSGPWEILSLAGTVTAEGAHLHASLSSATGEVVGGHVVAGNVVRTTVEALIAADAGWSLHREPDAATGFLELAPRVRGEAPDTA